MNLKKFGVLSATTLILSATSAYPILGLTNNVSADELKTEELTTNKIYHSKLFTNVVNEKGVHNNVNSFYEDGSQINQLLDENDNVIAAEIFDVKTSETLAVTRTSNEVIVEKTTKGYNGQNNVSTEKYPLMLMTNNDSTPADHLNISPRLQYTAWEYTNLAVGVNLFSTLVNIGTAALITFTAGVFGIATVAAEFLLEYMGAYGLSSGAAIADALDSSGNGWIGLYVREVWNDSWTVFQGTQHRTK